MNCFWYNTSHGRLVCIYFSYLKCLHLWHCISNFGKIFAADHEGESCIFFASFSYGQFVFHIVWFQKISIPPSPPLKIIGYSAGEGVFKGSYFRGLGGVHRKQLFQRVRNHEQNTESNVQSIVNTKTYERCFETKITTPGHWDEVKMFLFFFELASAPISRRTMCLWNEVETI